MDLQHATFLAAAVSAAAACFAAYSSFKQTRLLNQQAQRPEPIFEVVRMGEEISGSDNWRPVRILVTNPSNVVLEVKSATAISWKARLRPSKPPSPPQGERTLNFDSPRPVRPGATDAFFNFNLQGRKGRSVRIRFDYFYRDLINEIKSHTIEI
ncbi:hypothetical protein [Pseudophaeobacter flagellatus]|uniref:hypothetical protein n=1 Tax=Pseudophaeobacter flagellatus TaxID=2899119 RepID=UPI001E4247D5|nr:hypothetical protein [Pseudophaeobacter flagellatus]MCD9148500.1 hypothetical protein [Pseudophaeobacter flagellatus]